jgi:hypothetical protein
MREAKQCQDKLSYYTQKAKKKVYIKTLLTAFLTSIKLLILFEYNIMVYYLKMFNKYISQCSKTCLNKISQKNIDEFIMLK